MQPEWELPVAQAKQALRELPGQPALVLLAALVLPAVMGWPGLGRPGLGALWTAHLGWPHEVARAGLADRHPREVLTAESEHVIRLRVKQRICRQLAVLPVLPERCSIPEKRRRAARWRARQLAAAPAERESRWQAPSRAAAQDLPAAWAHFRREAERARPRVAGAASKARRSSTETKRFPAHGYLTNSAPSFGTKKLLRQTLRWSRVRRVRNLPARHFWRLPSQLTGCVR